MPAQLRAVVAIDNALTAHGVKALLEESGRFLVAAVVHDAGSVVEAVRGARPHALLLDRRFTMQDEALLACIAEAHADCGIVVLVPHSQDQCGLRHLTVGGTNGTSRLSEVQLASLQHCCISSLRDGARACIPFSAEPSELVEAAIHAAEGRFWCAPDLPEGWLDETFGQLLGATGSVAKLSPRERHIVSLVARGLANKEIARELGLSEQTVKNHLARVMGRLQLPSRVSVALYAVRERITCQPPI